LFISKSVIYLFNVNKQKQNIMKALKLFYAQRLISHNIKPYKVVKLKTGIKAEHYINGDIKIVKI